MCFDDTNTAFLLNGQPINGQEDFCKKFYSLKTNT